MTPKGNHMPCNNPPNPVPKLPVDPYSDPSSSDFSSSDSSDSSDDDYYKQRQFTKNNKINKKKRWSKKSFDPIKKCSKLGGSLRLDTYPTPA